MRRAEGKAAERDEREPNDGCSFSTNGAMLRSVEYFQARSFASCSERAKNLQSHLSSLKQNYIRLFSVNKILGFPCLKTIGLKDIGSIILENRGCEIKGGRNANTGLRVSQNRYATHLAR